MKFRGGGWVGGGWEAEGGQYHPQGDKQQCCVFSKAQISVLVRGSRVLSDPVIDIF